MGYRTGTLISEQKAPPSAREALVPNREHSPELGRSLGSYLRELQPGSECFACEGTLVAGPARGKPGLECRTCGAEVEVIDST